SASRKRRHYCGIFSGRGGDSSPPSLRALAMQSRKISWIASSLQRKIALQFCRGLLAMTKLNSPRQEKLPQQSRRYVRIFLREEMPGIDRRARNVGRPVLPGVERRRSRARNADIAPQRQHRDRDLPARFAIGLV